MDAVEYARPAMRVTEETAALVAELFAQLGQRSWWSGRPAAMGINALLRQIGDRGEAGALPLLVPVLLDGRAEVTNAASEVIRELRARLRPHLVPALDQQCRDDGSLRAAEPAWEMLAPSDLATLARRPAGAVALQIAMCHRNGFVREAAIRLVATCADGQELPFLLLRSRDWVAPVAAVATAAVRARLTAAHVDDLVAALPIVEAQRQWRRFVADPLLPEIDRLLATPVGRLALVRGLASPDRATRRAAYRHLLGPGPGGTQAANDPSLGELFERALTDADPAIRTWAARLLLDGDDASFRCGRPSCCGPGPVASAPRRRAASTRWASRCRGATCCSTATPASAPWPRPRRSMPARHPTTCTERTSTPAPRRGSQPRCLGWARPADRTTSPASAPAWPTLPRPCARPR